MQNLLSFVTNITLEGIKARKILWTEKDQFNIRNFLFLKTNITLQVKASVNLCAGQIY